MKENPVKNWSFSAWNLYNTCPAKYRYTKIDKLPEPQSPHLERGNKVHKEIEDYLVGKVSDIPASAASFSDLLPHLKAADPFCEQELAFKADWSRTQWRDWKNCWLRVKMDACAIEGNDGLIVDFKTGKKYDDNLAQVELFALAAMHIHPQVKEWDVRLWYVDSGEETQFTRHRSTKDRIKHEWTERIGSLFADTTFAPKPNKFCKWCHFRKSNGGPCSHG